ncbi:MAG: dihydroorotase [Peptococcia bacterium]
MDYILQGGLVIDPINGLEEELDLRIQDGRITELGTGLESREAEVIDLRGKIVAPGFIDIHVHLREPGGEANETIKTGCQAAAAGGFTAVAAMPNTKPCADNEGVVELVIRRARAVGLTKVYPIGTISKGMEGQEIAEIGSLYKAGAVAISDDGLPVVSSEVMRRAMEYSKIFNIPVISHCEEPSLAENGQMHEGYWSTMLGLKGIPAESEEIMVARDILLAKLTGAKLHLAHLSTKGSVALLRLAHSWGLQITAEATPHHILLTDEDVVGYSTSTKVNPPLRSAEDAEAVRQAVIDGTIQCLVTDHAPWSRELKDQEYALAPNGISGLETAIPVCWDTLVVKGGMSPKELIARFTKGPAQVINLDCGIRKGLAADLTVIDPELKKTVQVTDFYSQGKNNPFEGRTLQGWPVLTIVDGKVVMEDGRVKE